MNILIISTYYVLKDLLPKTEKYTPGYYICSCGLWYTLARCSLPVETNNCPNCKKIIGGKDHKLEKREGHFRVYLKEEHKKHVDSKEGSDIAGKLFVDFEKDIQKLIKW